MALLLQRSAPVIFRDELGSTNTELKAMALQGAQEGTVLAAARQTAGRGRLGRSFESPPGGLYMSMLLRPHCAPETLGTLTPCAAIAVRRAIKRLCGLDCAIKWPNDLLLEGKKLCGILTESSFYEGRPFVVLGIGVNVNSDPAAFPEELRPIVTSLAAALGRETELESLLAALVDELDTVYSLWQNEPAAFLEEYRAACISLGREALLMENGVSRPAYILGIDESYALIARSEKGEERISTGEVSLRSL